MSAPRPATSPHPATPPHPASQAHPNTEWFDTARLGLFVHFGLYSVAARHEWVMWYEKTPVDTYKKYAEFFDPDLFDPPRHRSPSPSGWHEICSPHHQTS